MKRVQRRSFFSLFKSHWKFPGRSQANTPAKTFMVTQHTLSRLGSAAEGISRVGVAKTNQLSSLYGFEWDSCAENWYFSTKRNKLRNETSLWLSHSLLRLWIKIKLNFIAVIYLSWFVYKLFLRLRLLSVLRFAWFGPENDDKFWPRLSEDFSRQWK